MREKISLAAQQRKHLPLRRFIPELEDFLTQELYQDFERWRPQEEAKVEARYLEIVQRFAREVNRTIARIRELSANVFALELEGAVEVEPLTRETSFYYKFGLDPEFLPLDPAILLNLLPRRLAQRYVTRKIQQRMEEDLDRNCGRIRWDLLQRCQKSLTAFKTTFNQMVEEVVEGIKRALDFALAERQKGMSQVEATLAAIRRQNEELEKIAAYFAREAR